MNIEGLNTIFGERIAHGVLYKISYKKRYNFEGFRFDADSGSVIVIQVTG